MRDIKLHAEQIFIPHRDPNRNLRLLQTAFGAGKVHYALHDILGWTLSDEDPPIYITLNTIYQ